MMDMWQDLFAAVALVFIIEGMLPFLKPEMWRKTMGRIAERPNGSLRFIGLLSMLMGVTLLYVIRQS